MLVNFLSVLSGFMPTSTRAFQRLRICFSTSERAELTNWPCRRPIRLRLFHIGFCVGDHPTSVSSSIPSPQIANVTLTSLLFMGRCRNSIHIRFLTAPMSESERPSGVCAGQLLRSSHLQTDRRLGYRYRIHLSQPSVASLRA